MIYYDWIRKKLLKLRIFKVFRTIKNVNFKFKSKPQGLILKLGRKNEYL